MNYKTQCYRIGVNQLVYSKVLCLLHAYRISKRAQILMEFQQFTLSWRRRRRRRPTHELFLAGVRYDCENIW